MQRVVAQTPSTTVSPSAQYGSELHFCIFVSRVSWFHVHCTAHCFVFATVEDCGIVEKGVAKAFTLEFSDVTHPGLLHDLGGGCEVILLSFIHIHRGLILGPATLWSLFSAKGLLEP